MRADAGLPVTSDVCFRVLRADGSDEPLGEHPCIVEHLVSTRPVSSAPACPVIGLSFIPHPLLMVVLLATHEVRGREVIPHPLLMVVLLATHEVRGGRSYHILC